MDYLHWNTTRNEQTQFRFIKFYMTKIKQTKNTSNGSINIIKRAPSEIVQKKILPESEERPIFTVCDLTVVCPANKSRNNTLLKLLQKPTLLCVHSRFAIILKRKRKIVVLLLLPDRFIVTINVLWFFLTVPWVGLHCVIVVFPDHTHFLTSSGRIIPLSFILHGRSSHTGNKTTKKSIHRDFLA